MSHTPPSIENILGLDGMLAANLKGFEFRPSQLQMAVNLAESIQKKIPALVEAGTGTGKTFGYLVPVVLSGKKTVISTGTKNLQEQIYFKDIPLLRNAAQMKIDAVIMKGRKNYLCLHRYRQFFAQPSLLNSTLNEKGQRIEEWIQTTPFADRSEVEWLKDDDLLWDSISSTSDQCLGSECLFLDGCFLGKLRSRAAGARIIIVNHHLFFADMKVKEGGFGEIIPRFQVAVFDEAHTVEEIAASYFGESISTRQLSDFVGEFEREVKSKKEGPEKKATGHLKTIRAEIEILKEFFLDKKEKGRLEDDELSRMDEGPVRNIRNALSAIRENPGLKASENDKIRTLLARAKELKQTLEDILGKKGENWLNWYERRNKSLVLYTSPLDISQSLNQWLYEKLETVVFTSATLSTGGAFTYIHSRLGLPEKFIQGIYLSDFDFTTQTLMYIPEKMPLPADPGFSRAAAEEIQAILERTKGRALVLFTSHYNLNMAHQILKDRIPYTLYKQGDAPRSVLLEAFKRDISSVLMATGSFWQGVDVPGETLSCLIIDKLPFDSPGEPLVGAKIDAIRNRGGNPFFEYQVPSAIISLKQGLGRLIRKSSDRGILSILDIRIRNTRYGKLFLKSLPPMPITHELDDIDAFFRKEMLTKDLDREL